MAYRSSGRFGQARHPPRYAASLTQPSPSFRHSSGIDGGKLVKGIKVLAISDKHGTLLELEQQPANT
ncbi:MAG: hypothetical protein ACJ8H8_14360, partial [Geminicoccaceae bacterium]